jgi:hypothetical protein
MPQDAMLRVLAGLDFTLAERGVQRLHRCQQVSQRAHVCDALLLELDCAWQRAEDDVLLAAIGDDGELPCAVQQDVSHLRFLRFR